MICISLSSLCDSLPSSTPLSTHSTIILRCSFRLITACQTRVYRKSKTKRQSVAALRVHLPLPAQSKALPLPLPPLPHYPTPQAGQQTVVSYHTPKGNWATQ